MGPRTLWKGTRHYLEQRNNGAKVLVVRTEVSEGDVFLNDGDYRHGRQDGMAGIRCIAKSNPVHDWKWVSVEQVESMLAAQVRPRPGKAGSHEDYWTLPWSQVLAFDAQNRAARETSPPAADEPEGDPATVPDGYLTADERRLLGFGDSYTGRPTLETLEKRCRLHRRRLVIDEDGTRTIT